jgi:hypothetical protein
MWRNALVLMAVVAGVAAAQDAQTSPESASPNAGPGDPVVRVTLNSNSVYDRGDRARVFVKVRDDGYIVVLHATPDGHVRALYPAEPTDENHVSGGSKFEVRARDEAEAFRVSDSHGTGMVYVAYSQSPFKFDNFMSGDHWDQDAFPDSGVTGHEEAVMTDIVQQMATGAHFDYDLATYRVAPPFHRGDQVYADNGYDNGSGNDLGYYPPPVVLSTYGPSPWWWGPAYYDPWFGYDPYFGYGGWGGPFFGVGFGFGGGCWGCGGGFFAGGPFFYHRPGWGIGYYHPGLGVGYRGGVSGSGGVFAGRSVGGVGVVGYRGRVAGGAAIGSRSVFSNVSVANRAVGSRAVGSRTVFPQTMGRSANVPVNSGRVMQQSGPVGSRVSASRVPSAGGAEGGRSFSSPGYGAGSRAPMPVARRVEPSVQSRAPSYDRTQSAPRSGGGSAGAPRSGGGGGAPHGGSGRGGGHHFSSGGGGHPGGGGGHGGGGGGGHHR